MFPQTLVTTSWPARILKIPNKISAIVTISATESSFRVVLLAMTVRLAAMDNWWRVVKHQYRHPHHHQFPPTLARFLSILKTVAPSLGLAFNLCKDAIVTTFATEHTLVAVRRGNPVVWNALVVWWQAVNTLHQM